MAKVVFWSPDANMTGNTSAAIAIATLMGILHKPKCLLMQGHFQSRKIESAYTPYSELKESGTLESSDIGIGALTKIVTSNKLTAETIKNYAKPVLKQRLDVLYGMNSMEKEQFTQMVNNLPYIVKKSDEIYDLVFVDLPKTTNHKYITDTLDTADLVLCVINQDITKLDEFFNKTQKQLKGKNIIYIIGDYEDKSKYNISNIRRKYSVKEPIYAVPHNYVFNDSCNDGLADDFMMRNVNADVNDYNGNFIFEVNKIVDKVLEMTKTKDM